MLMPIVEHSAELVKPMPLPDRARLSHGAHLYVVKAEMPRKRTEPAGSEADRVFRDRLNHLFEARPSPTGKPYSLQAVSAATGGTISAAHLSDLRNGKKGTPGVEILEALARFFGVDVGYFLGQASVRPAELPGVDDELMRALNNPLVRQIAADTGSFGPEEWREMMEILRHQVRLQRLTEERLRQEMATGQGQPPSASGDVALPRDITTAQRRQRRKANAPATPGDANHGERTE